MINLKIILADKGITASKLSKELGISKTTLTSYTRQRVKRIDIEIMNNIADYLNVSLDELFGRTSYKTGVSK